MIIAHIDPDLTRFEMRGHADFAPAGQDIVCAAASMLAAALAARCREIAAPGELRQCSLSPGHAVIRIDPAPGNRAAFRESFETVRAGLALIEKNYPENLILKKQKEQSKGGNRYE